MTCGTILSDPDGFHARCILEAAHVHGTTLGARTAVQHGEAVHVWSTIEVYRTEPMLSNPGTSRVVGCITPRQLAELVNRQLTAAGLETGESDLHPYPSEAADQEIPKHRWIACFAVTGGSEGHYIHIEAICDPEVFTLDDRPRPLSPHTLARISAALETVRRGVTYDRVIVPLLLAKTFMGMDRAVAIASACSHMLS